MDGRFLVCSFKLKKNTDIISVSKENSLGLVIFFSATLVKFLSIFHTCGTDFNTTGATLRQYPYNMNCTSVPRGK